MNFPKLTMPHWPAREPDPPGAIPASLVASAKAASWIAYFCLVYFLWLYTLDIAKDRAAPLHMTHVGLWATEGPGLLFWFPYIIGFAVIAIGIPYVAKIAIPTFMSLDWQGNAWPKGWALFIAMSVSLVVFAGTFTIQGDAILEKGRDAAVAVAQVEQSKAVLQAQIAAKEAELKSMMENRNAYLAQAASVGAAEWQRSYINQTPAGDAQRDRIVRALGAARTADATREEIARLRVLAATQTTTAAVSERVETRAGTSWIGGAIDYIQGIRAILLSLVMDIVALLMPWIALRLEQARSRQIGETPSQYMAIEDHSAEAVPQEIRPMEPMKQRRTFIDENGETVTEVRKKSHWAKVPTRKLKTKVAGKKDETEYEAPAKSVRLNEEGEDGQADLQDAARSVLGGAEQGWTPEGERPPAPDGDTRRGEGDDASAVGSDRGGSEPAPQVLAEKEDDWAESIVDEGRDHDLPQAPSQEPRGEDALAQDRSDETADDDAAETNAPETEPAPIVLDDDRIDELLDKGVLIETEDGIVAASQESQETIEQDDDYKPFPALAAPEREEAA